MTIVQIKSDKKDNTVDIIKTAIQSEIKRLELGLSKTERQIAKFEKFYRISSDTFLKKFTAENMKKKDIEYVAWAGELKIRERIICDIKRLREIQYVAN
ncbi:MAG: hypothetical protein HZA77_13975 [Candidatus Schekmanbacteria bacterium]|nr:hypothetical protein [Candidatus Schekmanbacteria bacterium]